MKAFELFRVGKHTSAAGSALEFTEAHLRAAVAAYDPALHEAPITVGHPKDNLPAYGWIKGISFADGTISAEPHQVEEQFADMVQAGRFKKRSASFYTPDAPNNPTPGSYYLRHVAFLGAQPPAVKGLKDVAFSDGDQSVEVEFGEGDRWAWGSVASLFRGLREWMIADKGMEAADKLIPSYALNDIESASRTAIAATPAVYPNFSEDPTMKTPQQLQAELDAAIAARLAAETENATLKTQAAGAANFAEQDASLKAREAAVAASEAKISRAAVETRIAAAVTAGKLLPKAQAGVTNFAMSLADAEATLEFGEGTAAKKVTQREAYLLHLENGPKLVEFGERSASASESLAPGEAGAQDVADKARALVDKAIAEGKHLSFTEAVAQATATITGD